MNENNFSHSPLLSLPFEAFEMILLRLSDSPTSVINLWEAVPDEACGEIERTFNTCSGRRRWSHWCRKYYHDPMVMTVLASYDTLVENDAESSFIIENDCKRFMWFSIYQAAVGLPTIIKRSRPVIENLSKLALQIKMEMSISSKGQSSGQGEDYLPRRQTGCNGMIAWNILYKNDALVSSEQVTLFANMSICQRMIPIAVKKVHRVHFLNIPVSEERKPSGDDIGILKVQRLMIIVSNSEVCIVPVHRGPEGISFTLSHYSFEKASAEYKMEPIIILHNNFVLIWSNPYDLKIYAVSVSHGRVECQLVVELNDTNINYLGNLWGKIAKYSPTIPYFFSFSLTPVQGKSVNDDEFDDDNYNNNGTSRQIYKFDLMLCSPKDYKHQASVSNYTSAGEKKFSFVKSTKILHQYDNIEEYQVVDALNNGHFSTSAAHGLFVAYSEHILSLSNNGTLWFFKRWDNDNASDNEHQHTMIKLEVVAPNMLAVVSKLTPEESLISMMEINFFSSTTAEDSSASGSEEEGDTGTEKLALILRKRVKVDFLTDGYTVSQLFFNYDKGVPYLWLELQKSEQERDDGDKKIPSDLQFEIFRVNFLPESEKQD